MKYLFVSALLLLISCGDAIEDIQGKWSAAGDHGDGHSWFIDYTFDDNDFIIDGYPPLHYEGTTELIERNGDTLEVMFHITSADPETEDFSETIILIENGLEH